MSIKHKKLLKKLSLGLDDSKCAAGSLSSEKIVHAVYCKFLKTKGAA